MTDTPKVRHRLQELGIEYEAGYKTKTGIINQNNTTILVGLENRPDIEESGGVFNVFDLSIDDLLKMLGGLR